ncbi:hypothetical protein ACVWZA_003728 [Sphingomonas sp. UYAg733]
MRFLDDRVFRPNGRCRVVAIVIGMAALLAGVAPPLASPGFEPVDPLTVIDDDFARHRDPAVWAGLSASRAVFSEGATTWRLWRIANVARPDGPLWVVTHDNENATFSAALDAVRSWGGVAMVVDTGPVDGSYSARFNLDTAGAPPIDPNRNFRDSLPLYAGHVLADLRPKPRLIVALHTNAPGFDAGLAGCGKATGGGSGEISIRLCNARFQPSPSLARRWPFDDDDSLALIPYLPGAGGQSAWCGDRLVKADFNVVFERVVKSDGSLSNYAAQHGLRYINFETRDLGSSPGGIAAARSRLVHMIDAMMDRCGDVPDIDLKRLASR